MGHKITEVSKQFLEAFEFQGIRRRDFLKFCGATAALLGLPDIYIPKIAAAIESASKRHPVVSAQRRSSKQHTPTQQR